MAAVTLEHISKMITPDKSISSAPRRFAVLGLRSVEDPAPVSLGNFTYEDSGEPVQTFRVEGERGHPPFREAIHNRLKKVTKNHMAPK